MSYRVYERIIAKQIIYPAYAMVNEPLSLWMRLLNAISDIRNTV